MQYNGYTGIVQFDEDAGLLHGEVVDIRDVITFQAENTQEIRKAFEESVDDYLTFCKERGEEPDKPFSGNFSVRVSPELHKQVFIASRHANKSLNIWVSEALQQSLRETSGDGQMPGDDHPHRKQD